MCAGNLSDDGALLKENFNSCAGTPMAMLLCCTSEAAWSSVSEHFIHFPPLVAQRNYPHCGLLGTIFIFLISSIYVMFPKD